MKEKTSDRVAKISLIIVSTVVAIVCVVGVALLSNTLFGNPISKKLAEKTALEYIEENYADDNCYIEDIWYEEKYEDYTVKVLSSTNEEINFTMHCNQKGEKTVVEYW